MQRETLDVERQSKNNSEKDRERDKDKCRGKKLDTYKSEGKNQIRKKIYRDDGSERKRLEQRKRQVQGDRTRVIEKREKKKQR